MPLRASEMEKGAREAPCFFEGKDGGSTRQKPVLRRAKALATLDLGERPAAARSGADRGVAVAMARGMIGVFVHDLVAFTVLDIVARWNPSLDFNDSVLMWFFERFVGDSIDSGSMFSVSDRSVASRDRLREDVRSPRVKVSKTSLYSSQTDIPF